MKSKDREAMKLRLHQHMGYDLSFEALVAIRLEVDRAVRKARREERARCDYPATKHPTVQDLGAAFDAAMKRRAAKKVVDRP
jgi:hypothetical protein